MTETVNKSDALEDPIQMGSKQLIYATIKSSNQYIINETVVLPFGPTLSISGPASDGKKKI